MEDFQAMTRIRVFLFATLAVIVAFGLSGQALAQDFTVGEFHMHATQVVPHANIPDATTALNQGIVAVGPIPALGGDGFDNWPCFGGGADCSAILPGGVVFGIPIQNWSLANCTAGDCGQVYWSFEDDVASGNLVVSFTIKQGKTTIERLRPANLGPITGAPGSIWVISCDCMKLSTKAVAGPATISVSTAVGTTKISGKATINLE
jgi:hypothetical protein